MGARFTQIVLRPFVPLLVLILGSLQAGQNPPHVLFPVPVEGKYGFIDRAGNIVVKPQFYHASAFSEGMAVVSDGKKYGYVGRRAWSCTAPSPPSCHRTRTAARPRRLSGEVVIEIDFEEAADFSDGLALVSKDGKRQYIDRSGKAIVELAPVNRVWGIPARKFSEGLAAVLIDNKWGYLDTKGKLIIPAQFDFAEDFSEGLAVVGIADPPNRPKFGYINKAGKIRVGLNFYHAKRFREGVASVAVPEIEGSLYKNALINASGDIIYGPVALSLGEYQEELMDIYNRKGQKGFMNRQGKIVIEPAFEEATPFSEGLSSVFVSSGKWGYIDRKGQFVIEPRFDMACPFANGLAKVIEGNKLAYITRGGRIVWGPSPIPEDEERATIEWYNCQ